MRLLFLLQSPSGDLSLLRVAFVSLTIIAILLFNLFLRSRAMRSTFFGKLDLVFILHRSLLDRWHHNRGTVVLLVFQTRSGVPALPPFPLLLLGSIDHFCWTGE